MGTAVVVMTYPKRYKQGLALSQRMNALLSVDIKSEGAFHGSLRAWEMALSLNMKHCLLLQDDVEPCINFTIAVERLINSKPDRAISLYNQRGESKLKHKQGVSFFETSFYQFGQAWLMPSNIVKHMLNWIQRALNPLPFSDPAYALYFYLNKIPVLIANPSVVQHTGTSQDSYKSNKASDSRSSYLCTDGKQDLFNGSVIRIEKTKKEMVWLTSFRAYLK